MAIRNVIFDLGGVVLDWNPDKILSHCYQDLGHRRLVEERFFRHADWRAFDRGELEEPELIARACERTGRPVEELNRVLETVRHSLTEKSDTVSIMRSLHRQDVPLYCLSNMPVPIFAHLRQHHTFWDVFRGIVISGEVRMSKPEPELFNHILNQYKLLPGETVLIDDHPPNIQGAKSVGMDAILFGDADQCRRELESRLGIRP